MEGFDNKEWNQSDSRNDHIESRQGNQIPEQNGRVSEQDNRGTQGYGVPIQDNRAVQGYGVPNQDDRGTQGYGVPNQDNRGTQGYGVPIKDDRGAQSYGVPIRDDRGAQSYRVPEYSFWAEQMSGRGTYQENAQRQGFWDYSHPEAAKDTAAGSETPAPKKKGRVFRFIVKAACFGILAGAGFIGSLTLYHRLNPESEMENTFILGSGNEEDAGEVRLTVSSTEQGTVQRTTGEAVSKMVDATMPSIVSIRSISTQTDYWFGREYSSEGSGSGIIVGKNEKELLIATNNHVVAGTDQITVTFIDGKEVNAVIKGTDAAADLAVVTVDLSKMDSGTLKAIKIAKQGNSDEVKVGEMAIAIGNALGYGQSVTVGYISAKDRKVEVSDNYSYKTMVLLQTDAAINPGNSGGALLNIDGEVIGINTVKYTSNAVEGMGYAIPISRATPIINDLMNREILETKDQGFLGVTPTDVTEEISKMYNIPVGVFMSEVMEGGAADKAGLLQGDIITKVNDKEISSSTQLRELVSSIKAGTEVTVTFMRAENGSYKEHTIKVTLGSRSEMPTTE